MPRFAKAPEEIERPEERWLYLLKNAGQGAQLPDFGNDAFESALERIRVDLADDGLLNSQEAKMVTQEEYDTRIASAELRGEARGAIDAKREMAKGLREDGVPMDIIVRRSGLSEEEIKAL